MTPKKIHLARSKDYRHIGYKNVFKLYILGSLLQFFHEYWVHHTSDP